MIPLWICTNTIMYTYQREEKVYVIISTWYLISTAHVCNIVGLFVFQTNKKATDEDEGNQSLSLLTFNFGCTLYVLAGYGAYIYICLCPCWARGKDMRRSRGTVAVYFKGVNCTVALADRCRPSQFDKGSFFFQINNFCKWPLNLLLDHIYSELWAQNF